MLYESTQELIAFSVAPIIFMLKFGKDVTNGSPYKHVLSYWVGHMTSEVDIITKLCGSFSIKSSLERQHCSHCGLQLIDKVLCERKLPSQLDVHVILS